MPEMSPISPNQETPISHTPTCERLPGPTTLQTWFKDAAGNEFGAYWLYVRRIPS